VRGYPDWFYFLGQGDVFGVPTQLLVLFLAIIVFGVALDRTTFGRTLYAIGSNETAARFSALPVERVKLAAYTLSGLNGQPLGPRAGVARHDDPLRHGHGLRTRRHRRGGARRHPAYSAAPGRSGAP